MANDVLNGDGEADNVRELKPGRSIEDRAGDGDHEVPEEELFPTGSLEGDSKTLATLLRRNLPIETTVSLRAAEVPLREGLPDPERAKRLNVTAQFEKVEVVLIREEGQIVGAKARVIFRPTYVEALVAEDELEAAAAPA